MLLCYSAIPSRSLRSAYQLMISGGDVKAVQGTTLVQAAPVEAEPTISMSALLELLKDADPADPRKEKAAKTLTNLRGFLVRSRELESLAL